MCTQKYWLIQSNPEKLIERSRMNGNPSGTWTTDGKNADDWFLGLIEIFIECMVSENTDENLENHLRSNLFSGNIALIDTIAFLGDCESIRLRKSIEALANDAEVWKINS